MELVMWCGRVIPCLVAIERLALGMTTDVIEIADKRPESIGARMARAAEAIELAIVPWGSSRVAPAQKDR